MNKGILFRRVGDCEEIPRGYGLVCVDFLRREGIYSPVPLNLLFGLVRSGWLWLLHGYYTGNMARRERMHSVLKTDGVRAGILFRRGSLWIGMHWSPANRRLCINLVPCVTIWIVGAGGVVP